MAAWSWSVPPCPSPDLGAADHISGADCVRGQVPEVGRDECILRLITALMRPQVKSEHAKEPPEEAASQEAINHLLPLTYCAKNLKLCSSVFFKKHNRAFLTIAGI